MNLLIGLVLLFAPVPPVRVYDATPAKQQAVQVGGHVTPADVQKAKAVLLAAEPKELKLKVGEFEIVEPSKDAKPLQFQYLTNDSYHLYQVMPGETLAFIGIRRGSDARVLHRFEPKPYRWAIIEAKKQGSEIVVINRNGNDIAKDAPEEVDRIKVVVGDPLPPKPEPKPDDPPKPTPIPGEGFRVLIVRETKDLSNLPASQVAIFSAREVREYLGTKCVLEGNQRAFRIWDQDTDVSREAQHWQDAMKRKRDSLPWLLVTNGKEGYEGPLPKDVPEMMALLKKYGGN